MPFHWKCLKTLLRSKIGGRVNQETVENINTDFINSFLAKTTGTVASAFIYGKYIPTMTEKSVEQMENLSVLLTREQIEIVSSQHKHIIIRCDFGCGKTRKA